MNHLPTDTCTVTEFRRHSMAVIERVRATGRPILLTRYGRGIAVLVPIETYEGLVDKTARLRDLFPGRPGTATEKPVPGDTAFGAEGMLPPVSPGEILRDEFLAPLGMSEDVLAEEIGVPTERIVAIVAGRRPITTDIDLRLCEYFGLTSGYWLRAQADFDSETITAQLDRVYAEDQ